MFREQHPTAIARELRTTCTTHTLFGFAGCVKREPRSLLSISSRPRGALANKLPQGGLRLTASLNHDGPPSRSHVWQHLYTQGVCARRWNQVQGACTGPRACVLHAYIRKVRSIQGGGKRTKQRKNNEGIQQSHAIVTTHSAATEERHTTTGHHGAPA